MHTSVVFFSRIFSILSLSWCVSALACRLPLPLLCPPHDEGHTPSPRGPPLPPQAAALCSTRGKGPGAREVSMRSLGLPRVGNPCKLSVLDLSLSSFDLIMRSPPSPCVDQPGDRAGQGRDGVMECPMSAPCNLGVSLIFSRWQTEAYVSEEHSMRNIAELWNAVSIFSVSINYNHSQERYFFRRLTTLPQY